MSNTTTETVTDRIIRAIRDMIQTRSLTTGDQLPAQRELAAMLGVSRASLREALTRLSAMGELEVRIGKGAFVRGGQAEDEARALIWPFEAVAPKALFQYRFALEGFAAGIAAVTLSAQALDQLQDNVQEMGLAIDAGNYSRATDLDFIFHETLIRQCQNPMISQLLAQGAEIFMESQKLPFIRPERARETWHEHQRILAALENHDSKTAQQAMQSHIRRAAQRTGITFAVPLDWS